MNGCPMAAATGLLSGSLLGPLHATILVGIGFASYLVPILRTEVEVTPSHKDKSHVKYTIT